MIDITLKMNLGEIYSRNTLWKMTESEHPSINKNSFQWTLGSLLSSGRISKIGYNEYILGQALKKDHYKPQYSKITSKLISDICSKYDSLNFVVFETSLLNEFLNHLIAQNTIFLQVEKEMSIFVFRYLQSAGYENIIYKPRSKDLDLYWANNCIVITDLPSESPLSDECLHTFTLEKLLVDIYCDKLISSTYSSAEYTSIAKQAKERYALNEPRMLRYARRRNKEKEIAEYYKE